MRVNRTASMAGLVLAGNLLTGAQGGTMAAPMTEQVATADYVPSAEWNREIGEEQAFSLTNGQSLGIPIVDDETAEIPADAVRLRIISNSDSPGDQTLKRQIRDRIIAEVGKRLQGITTQEAARQKIQADLPALNELAAAVIKEQGYSYSVTAEYGKVPFPTKLYGNQVYPAGSYEALRIIIGEGKGANWWCVLFPPLCFVDVANGDAVPAQVKNSKPLTTIEVPTGDNQTAQTVQVRLGILDALRSLLVKIAELWT